MNGMTLTGHQMSLLNALVARVAASTDRSFTYDPDFQTLDEAILPNGLIDVYDHKGMRYLRLIEDETVFQIEVGETPVRKTLYVDKPEGPDDDGPGGTPVAMAA